MGEKVTEGVVFVFAVGIAVVLGVLLGLLTVGLQLLAWLGRERGGKR